MSEIMFDPSQTFPAQHPVPPKDIPRLADGSPDPLRAPVEAVAAHDYLGPLRDVDPNAAANQAAILNETSPYTDHDDSHPNEGGPAAPAKEPLSSGDSASPQVPAEAAAPPSRIERTKNLLQKLSPASLAVRLTVRPLSGEKRQRFSRVASAAVVGAAALKLAAPLFRGFDDQVHATADWLHDAAAHFTPDSSGHGSGESVAWHAAPEPTALPEHGSGAGTTPQLTVPEHSDTTTSFKEESPPHHVQPEATPEHTYTPAEGSGDGAWTVADAQLEEAFEKAGLDRDVSNADTQSVMNAFTSDDANAGKFYDGGRMNEGADYSLDGANKRITNIVEQYKLLERARKAAAGETDDTAE